MQYCEKLHISLSSKKTQTKPQPTHTPPCLWEGQETSSQVFFILETREFFIYSVLVYQIKLKT